MFNKKTGNITFFLVKIDFPIFLNTYDFFRIFEHPVYRKLFETYFRNVSIDYPETS